tara:strand:- start:870 stop:1703 length:834 start_codon:yes stop_codon:yes gene_type:complete
MTPIIIKGIDKKDPQKIKNLIFENRFVVIENKNILPEQELVDFYKTLGSVHTQGKKFMSDEYVEKYSGGFRELIAVRNKDLSGYGENGLFAGLEDGEVDWHCASQNRKYCEDIVAFCIRQLGNSGGNLQLSDARKPYENIDVGFKSMIEDIEVEFELGIWEDFDSEDGWNFKELIGIDGVPAKDTELKYKKIITKHSVDNKKGFHYSWPIVFKYRDFQEDEFKIIHDKIVSTLMQEQYIYTHEWKLGDIILQEQEHSLHRRDPYTGDRLLYRSAIYI